MNRETPARPSGLSNPTPIYVVGLFGMGYTDFYIFLIPLYGVAGFLVALKEGIEVNVLGLNLGIDALAPAVNLPAIGRVGMAP